MALKINLELPADVEDKLRHETSNLDADVQELYALELFRRGRLTHSELSRVLKLDRFQTDAFLKQQGVFEGSLTMADLEEDRQTLDRVMHKSS